jgi:hypothetical protein
MGSRRHAHVHYSIVLYRFAPAPAPGLGCWAAGLLGCSSSKIVDRDLMQLRLLARRRPALSVWWAQLAAGAVGLR